MSKSRQRKKKKKIKLQISCFLGFFVVVVFCSISFFKPNIFDSPTKIIGGSHQNENNGRHLTGLTPELLTQEQLKSGGVILHLMGMCYTFVGIALVCDEFFVPALEIIGEWLEWSDDVSGATLMAAGGSAPELFTSLIGTLVMKTDVGFGTIVGSAVFNVLFVIAMCAIFSREVLTLTGYPLARDSCYYAFSLLILALFFGFLTPKQIMWWEALILLFMYFGYVFLMKNNDTVYGWVNKSKSTQEEEGTVTDQTSPNRNGMAKKRKDSELLPELGRPPTFKTGIVEVLKLLNSTDVNRVDNNMKYFIDVCKRKGKKLTKEKMKQILLATGHKGDDETFFQNWETEPLSAEEFEEWYEETNDKIKEGVEAAFCSDTIKLATLTQNLQNFATGTTEVSSLAEDFSQYIKKSNSQNQDTCKRDTFYEWYRMEQFFTNAAIEDDPAFPTWPQDFQGKLSYLFTAPLMYPMYYSMPDVKKKEKATIKNGIISFFMSIFWIGFFSTFMVEWSDTFGTVLGIPPKVMGLTLIAAGTSIPDLISSVIVARQGKGDMAVSSSIGSNIFDILVGLPIPWLLANIIFQQPVGVESGESAGKGSLLFSIVVLMGMLVSTIITIAICGWKLTKNLAFGMMILYIIFVAQDLLRAYNVIPSPV